MSCEQSLQRTNRARNSIGTTTTICVSQFGLRVFAIQKVQPIEEQDELIYKFCVQFVQKDFHFLPIANAVGRAAVSDRLILGDMASLGISYWNPNMVGCKN